MGFANLVLLMTIAKILGSPPAATANVHLQLLVARQTRTAPTHEPQLALAAFVFQLLLYLASPMQIARPKRLSATPKLETVCLHNVSVTQTVPAPPALSAKTTNVQQSVRAMATALLLVPCAPTADASLNPDVPPMFNAKPVPSPATAT